MRAIRFPLSVMALSAAIMIGWASNSIHAQADQKKATVSAGDTISLPAAKLSGSKSVEEAISQRRSVREISDAVLELGKLSQLLWAAQGITDKKNGFRAAPSAGAKYPLEIYVFAGNIENLPAGLYRYLPDGHRLLTIANYDCRSALARSIYDYESILTPPLVLVIGADFSRTESKYGTARSPRYVYIEAGACAENIALQAQTLYLSTVLMGAFDDNFVFKACRMEKEQPVLIMPVGYQQK